MNSTFINIIKKSLMQTYRTIIFTVIIFFIIFFFFCNLFFGTVHIPIITIKNILLGHIVRYDIWENIVLQTRLPQAITALFAGAALAISGLMLQILFKNPLSGPDVLGISSGANLGVAIILLYYKESINIKSTFFSLKIDLSTIFAAFLGASVVLFGILFCSTKIKSNFLVLIIGIMIGYLSSSVISILYSFASSDNIKSYIFWGLGSFSNITTNHITAFSVLLSIGLLASSFLIKPLNILLLGDHYATNLGINIKTIKITILITTGFLVAIVTAFCGPIGFIGLIVPHISRIIFNTSNQRCIFPATLLLGSALSLFCNWITIAPFFSYHFLTLNAVIPLIGAPLIIFIIINKKNQKI